MADNDLHAEYADLLKEFDRTGNRLATEQLHENAILHILRRLGPPEPLDGVEAETLTEREA